MWLGGIKAVYTFSKVSQLCRRFQSSLSIDEVIRSLQERGLASQCTRVGTEGVPNGSSVYVGFDPTADSLHTGNLIAILALIHFRRTGFQPIAVIGGATGRVGDPSGRSRERDKLPQDTIKQNLEGISNDLTRIFYNVKEYLPVDQKVPDLLVLNNADWWDDVSGVHFVSDIARHFRLSSMLAKESVKQRLHSDEGMSCAEFLYPIFQAYDFLHLNKHHRCWMQLGGGDQWGNITAGCEFVRKATGSIVHGLTLPLLTSSSGEKLSKSTGNAVWLSPNKTSPFEFYQTFVQTPDQDVGSWLKYFTFLSLEEINNVLRHHQEAPSKFVAQKSLAEQITRLVHGEKGLEQARNATSVLFDGGGVDSLMKLSVEDLEQLFRNAPTTELPISLLGEGEEKMTVTELAVQSGAVDSYRHAESLIKRGGLYVNLARVDSGLERVDMAGHLLVGNMTILRVGKKMYRIVKWK